MLSRGTIAVLRNVIFVVPFFFFSYVHLFYI